MLGKLLAAVLVGAVTVSALNTSAAQSDNPFVGPFWEIRGRWTWTPNEDSSFGLYNSREKAEAEIARIQRDHAPGGLLEFASNKPFGLYVQNPQDDGPRPGPKIPPFLDAMKTVKEATQAVASAQKIAENAAGGIAKLVEPSKGLKNFVKAIQGGYERAKQAKDNLLSATQTISAEQFQKVNGLIAEYNRDLERSKSGPNGDQFAQFPAITPVDADVLRKAQPFKDAVQERLELESDKEKRDAEKERLDQERELLIEERRRLEAVPDPDQEAARRERVQKYLADRQAYENALAKYEADKRGYSEQLNGLQPPVPPPPPVVKPEAKPAPKEDGGSGPFRLFTGAYSNTADRKGNGGSGEEFASLAEAQAKAARHMAARAGGQPSYRIEDKNGVVIEARGLFSNFKAKP